jgi:hypothetical protein
METACGAIVSRVAELGLGYCRNRFAAVPRKLRTLTNGYLQEPLAASAEFRKMKCRAARAARAPALIPADTPSHRG